MYISIKIWRLMFFTITRQPYLNKVYEKVNRVGSIKCDVHARNKEYMHNVDLKICESVYQRIIPK
jgi:hypothetical protein